MIWFNILNADRFCGSFGIRCIWLRFLYIFILLTLEYGQFVHCFVIHNDVYTCIFALAFTLILCPFEFFFLIHSPSVFHALVLIFTLKPEMLLSKRCILPFATYNVWFNALKSNLFYEFRVHAMRTYILFSHSKKGLCVFFSIQLLRWVSYANKKNKNWNRKQNKTKHSMVYIILCYKILN